MDINKKITVNFCDPDIEIDITINIASMQEMNAPTVKAYFAFLRSHLKSQNYFYCCNRREKVMPGGEISRFDDYPWDVADRVAMDGPCPWHRYYFSHHPTKNGLKVFGLRAPFVNFFDGVIWHRLTALRTELKENR